LLGGGCKDLAHGRMKPCLNHKCNLVAFAMLLCFNAGS
jgi:hypothetical protein